MTADSSNRLVSCLINMAVAHRYLKDPAKMLPWYTGFKTDSTSEYEVLVGDVVGPRVKHAKVDQFSPVGVAGTVAKLKKKTLREMFLETSALNEPVPYGYAPYKPVFYAYPYAFFSEDSLSSFEEKSSALHVNVSLYNAKGENLFSKDPELMKHCARELVRIQDEAGLAFLPRNSSLKRFGAKTHVSVPRGLGMEPIPDKASQKCFSSVGMRGKIYDESDDDKHAHDTRIENRLPGADADPFVSLAVTMAAMVSAVRSYSKGKASDYRPKFPMKDNHRELVETFESSQRMYELLGKDFYSTILNAYERSGGASRGLP